MRKEDEERKEMSRERMEKKEILDLYRNLNKNQKQRIKIIMRGMKGKVFQTSPFFISSISFIMRSHSSSDVL